MPCHSCHNVLCLYGMPRRAAAVNRVCSQQSLRLNTCRHSHRRQGMYVCSCFHLNITCRSLSFLSFLSLPHAQSHVCQSSSILHPLIAVEPALLFFKTSVTPNRRSSTTSSTAMKSGVVYSPAPRGSHGSGNSMNTALAAVDMLEKGREYERRR